MIIIINKKKNIWLFGIIAFTALISSRDNYEKSIILSFSYYFRYRCKIINYKQNVYWCLKTNTDTYNNIEISNNNTFWI